MIPLPEISQLAVLGFAALAVAAAISDARHLIIPNRYCLAIAVLYPAYVLSPGPETDWISATAISGALLFLGFLLHSREIIGGGDAKLIAAAALWAGSDFFVDFLILTGIAGGTMALGLWFHHRLKRAAGPAALLTTAADPQFAKQPMPYAVAIATGSLYVAFTLLG
jgi:prepilin peptidase CpaA